MRKPLFAALSILALAAPVPAQRILVGPDVLVSNENEYPHVEMAVAAHPSDPKRLVAGTMALGGASGTQIYASPDGGATWTPAYPAERIPAEADPLVLYTPKGTALFVDIPVMTEGSRQLSPLAIYRSEDGGRVWQKPFLLRDHAYDHPQIAADPRSGRIYLSTLYGRESILGLFRSDDDGRTFTGPQEVAKLPEDSETGLNTTGLATLSDGTLVFCYVEYSQEPEKPDDLKLWVRTSADGSVAFSEPVLAARMAVLPLSAPRARLSTFPLMTVDGSAGPYRDRIYVVWTDFATGLPRVLISASADRGKTWSEPRAAAGPLPEGAYAFQPAIAVNRDGVLGVSWLDTRNAPGTDRYDAWFTASLDGGATFLPPVRVSSETSDLQGPGNLRPAPGAWRTHENVLRVTFLTAASRYPGGGDYTGLAADASGAFHPIWPDARSGAFQAWTVKVRVERAPAARTEARGEPVDLNPSVELSLDPASYDPATRELRVPIRLRNVSDKRIRGPLLATVKTFGSGMGERYRENTPTLLNATNGKPGAGAVFDYTAMMGDDGFLEPGAVTRPIVWRFKVVDVLTPDMHVEVTGRVE